MMNLKYEIDAQGNLRLDRILSSSMSYPGNYGYIPNTLSGDGDPLDILANGTRIAKGEVVMVGEKFGIRFTEVVAAEEIVQNL